MNLWQKTARRPLTAPFACLFCNRRSAGEGQRVDPYDAEAVRGALRAGIRAAQLTVESEASVGEGLSARALEEALAIGA